MTCNILSRIREDRHPCGLCFHHRLALNQHYESAAIKKKVDDSVQKLKEDIDKRFGKVEERFEEVEIGEDRRAP